MDISPEMWAGIILITSAAGGALMWWSTSPRSREKKYKLFRTGKGNVVIFHSCWYGELASTVNCGSRVERYAWTLKNTQIAEIGTL